MERIESSDDPRVAAFRGLRDRTLRGESVFVAEGRWLVQRLLASDYPALAVFVSDEYAGEFLPLVPPDVPIYVARESLLLDVVGFKFHRGVLALGQRRPPLALENLAARVPGHSTARGEFADGWRLVVCPEITKPENMGLVFRAAAGFGLHGIVLGERSCDPFSRRCLRVSMGAVFRVPFARSTDVVADLRRLKDRYTVTLMAAVLDPQAQPLDAVLWPARAAVLIGNESDGLRDRCLALCDDRVTIPMQPGTDSLNLGVAAGIFVYEMMRPRPARGN